MGVGILLAFIEIKIAGLYKKYCWDMITIMVILVSMAIAIYFADWIRTILPVNLLFLLLLVQVIYVVIRWYVKGWRETSGSFPSHVERAIAYAPALSRTAAVFVHPSST